MKLFHKKDGHFTLKSVFDCYYCLHFMAIEAFALFFWAQKYLQYCLQCLPKCRQCFVL